MIEPTDLDAEFTVEPEDWRSEPQWRAFERFSSPSKVRDALTYLDYEGECDGLYHYRDRRYPAEVYTLPSERTVRIYQLENQIREKKYGRLHEIAYGVKIFGGCLLVVGLLATMAKHQDWMLFLGIPVLVFVLGWAVMQFPAVPVLPIFRTFLSDEEHEQIRKHEVRKEAAKAAAVLAYSAYRLHERHEQRRMEQMADILADRMNPKHW